MGRPGTPRCSRACWGAIKARSGCQGCGGVWFDWLGAAMHWTVSEQREGCLRSKSPACRRLGHHQQWRQPGPAEMQPRAAATPPRASAPRRQLSGTMERARQLLQQQMLHLRRSSGSRYRSISSSSSIESGHVHARLEAEVLQVLAAQIWHSPQ